MCRADLLAFCDCCRHLPASQSCASARQPAWSCALKQRIPSCACRARVRGGSRAGGRALLCAVAAGSTGRGRGARLRRRARPRPRPRWPRPLARPVKGIRGARGGHCFVHQALPLSWRRKKSNSKTVFITFAGEYFAHSPMEHQVCRLHPNYDVYVSNIEMRDLMRQPSATSLVRTAMRAVFTIDARTKCSVSGKASPSRLGVIEIRTPLHPDGVEAILDFARLRAVQNHWPELDITKLKHAMGNALCEDRVAQRLSAAEYGQCSPNQGPLRTQNFM